MDRLIDIASVVIFISMIMYAAIKLDEAARKLRDEEERTKKLEEYKVYVKTKQFAEEVAKEKLGLVNPDEILLKPNK